MRKAIALFGSYTPTAQPGHLPQQCVWAYGDQRYYVRAVAVELTDDEDLSDALIKAPKLAGEHLINTEWADAADVAREQAELEALALRQQAREG